MFVHLSIHHDVQELMMVTAGALLIMALPALQGMASRGQPTNHVQQSRTIFNFRMVTHLAFKGWQPNLHITVGQLATQIEQLWHHRTSSQTGTVL